MVLPSIGEFLNFFLDRSHLESTESFRLELRYPTVATLARIIRVFVLSAFIDVSNKRGYF